MNRPFTSKRITTANTSSFLTVPKGDVRYVNEPISEDLNMNNHRITNLPDGTDLHDPVTITQMDEVLIRRDDAKNDMENKKVINVLPGTEPTDAVTVSQHNNMNNRKIINVAEGVELNDAATVSQVQRVQANFNRNIIMNNNRVTYLEEAIDPHDAVNLYQVRREKHTAQQNISMNGNRIINLGRSIDENDAVTKAEVRAQITAMIPPTVTAGLIKIKEGIMTFNRHNIAILFKPINPIVPLSLLIQEYNRADYEPASLSYDRKYNQEPFFISKGYYLYRSMRDITLRTTNRDVERREPSDSSTRSNNAYDTRPATYIETQREETVPFYYKSKYIFYYLSTNNDDGQSWTEDEFNNLNPPNIQRLHKLQGTRALTLGNSLGWRSPFTQD